MLRATAVAIAKVTTMMFARTGTSANEKGKDHISEEEYANTTGNYRWSDDESNTSKQEWDVQELSDEDIKAIAHEVVFNFRLCKVYWREEYSGTGLPPAAEKLDIFNNHMFLNPGKIYHQPENMAKNAKRIDSVHDYGLKELHWFPSSRGILRVVQLCC